MRCTNCLAPLLSSLKGGKLGNLANENFDLADELRRPGNSTLAARRRKLFVEALNAVGGAADINRVVLHNFK